MKKRIAIQGIVGSFHEEAARKYFSDEIEIIECDSFKTVCKALENEEADYGAMAIENTIAGSLLPNYALLREYHFKIIGEVFLHIQMNLLVYPGVTLDKIEYVHSHPIAIGQCADFLETLPNVKIIEKKDTASAAREIINEKLTNTASISSIAAAKLFGLDVLEKRIETNKKNYTRFLILSKYGNGQTANKASVCFEVGHHPGALSRILNIFTKYKINLTKIQSIPILGKPYEYSFHVDLEWNENASYEKAIHAVLKDVSNLSILGEYQKGEIQTL